MNYLPERDNFNDIPFNYLYGPNFSQDMEYQNDTNEFYRPYWENNDTSFFNYYSEIIPKDKKCSYVYNNENEANIPEEASYPQVGMIEIVKEKFTRSIDNNSLQIKENNDVTIEND